MFAGNQNNGTGVGVILLTTTARLFFSVRCRSTEKTTYPNRPAKSHHNITKKGGGITQLPTVSIFGEKFEKKLGGEIWPTFGISKFVYVTVLKSSACFSCKK